LEFGEFNDYYWPLIKENWPTRQTRQIMHNLTKRVSALEELLKQKDLVDDKTFPDYEKLVTEDWVPNNGARLIAKAWLDPEFKEFLLADGKSAASSLGFSMPEHHGSLVVKENTE
jgi:nitrile hydratase